MKKLAVIILTLISASATAQTSVYHPFPEDTATWVSDAYSNSCLGYCTSVFYEMKGDTLINSNSYNKIYIRDGSFYYINQNGDYSASFSACSYKGAVREDSVNKKVYFIDNTMTDDTLLYDFNLIVSDTIHSLYNETGMTFPLVVSSIDSININGNYHKRFNFFNHPSQFDQSLIEGIGWSGSLLGLVSSGDHALYLSCFNGSMVVGSAFNNECAVSLECSISVNVNEQNKKEHSSLFPNPFHTSATLKLSPKFETSQLNIYNTFGEQVMQQKIVSLTTVINRNAFLAGIYFYQIINKEGEIIFGKFIIE